MLYKINEQLYRLLEGEGIEPFIDKETGEFDLTGMQNSIKDLRIAQEEETEQLALYVKDLNADIEQIDAEIKALEARRRRKEVRVGSLSKLLVATLQTLPQSKFEVPRVALSIRKSEVVEVTDFGKLSTEYIHTKTEASVDKTAIKLAVKQGKEVPGASLVTHQNLQIK